MNGGMNDMQEEVRIPLDPEARGSEDPEAPGEPIRAEQPVSEPVPGTGYEAKREHRREHNAEGNTPKERDLE
jgi:hypothetical protein